MIQTKLNNTSDSIDEKTLVDLAKQPTATYRACSSALNEKKIEILRIVPPKETSEPACSFPACCSSDFCFPASFVLEPSSSLTLLSVDALRASSFPACCSHPVS